MLTLLIILWLACSFCRPWYGGPYRSFGGWYRRPPMGRHSPWTGGWHRPPMGGFGGFSGFGGGRTFGGGGHTFGGGAGRGRR